MPEVQLPDPPPELLGDGPLLLTVEEACHLIRQSRATGYRLIETGELPSVKIGASRRVPMAALRAFVDRLIAEQIGEL